MFINLLKNCIHMYIVIKGESELLRKNLRDDRTHETNNFCHIILDKYVCIYIVYSELLDTGDIECWTHKHKKL